MLGFTEVLLQNVTKGGNMSDEHKWRIVELEGDRLPYAVQYNPNAGSPQFVQSWLHYGYASSKERAFEILKEERACLETEVTETVIHTE